MSNELREEEAILHALSKVPGKWCVVCNAFASHFADFHNDTEEPEPEFVAETLREARARLAGSFLHLGEDK
jgi:hypothetical protein